MIHTLYSIARTTYQESSRLPVFWVLLLIFGALVALSGEVTLFSLGDEQIMIREMGIATIALFSFLLILFTATRAIHDEITNQTLITLLAKPVSRHAVLLGKYFGILWTVVAASLPMAATLVLVLWFYGGLPEVEKQERLERAAVRRAWIAVARAEGDRGFLTVPQVQAAAEAIPTAGGGFTPYYGKVQSHFLPALVPLGQGMLLVLLQCVVLTAIGTVLSIRLAFPLTATFSFALFTLGHLSPYLRTRLTAPGTPLPLHWFGEALYRVLPNLETYNLSAAREDGILTTGYLLGATGSALLYATFLLLLGTVLLERTEAAGAPE